MNELDKNIIKHNIQLFFSDDERGLQNAMQDVRLHHDVGNTYFACDKQGLITQFSPKRSDLLRYLKPGMYQGSLEFKMITEPIKTTNIVAIARNLFTKPFPLMYSSITDFDLEENVVGARYTNILHSTEQYNLLAKDHFLKLLHSSK